MSTGSRCSARRFLGVLALLAWASLSGCMHRYRSAIYLPCKAAEIKVSEEVYSPTEETWVASCRGRDYGCWATSEGNKVHYGCKAMRQSARRTPKSSAPDAGS